MQFPDRLIQHFDSALRVMAGVSVAGRANPAAKVADGELDSAQRLSLIHI